MRRLSVVVNELKLEINSEFPDWNLICRLAEEADFIEENRDYINGTLEERVELRKKTII